MRILKPMVFMTIGLILISACEKSTGPSDDNPYKQKQIPWPSLADSPWPMFRHDAQNTGRSQYEGPISLQYTHLYQLENTNNGTSPILDESGNIYFVNGQNYYAISSNGDQNWSIPHSHYEDQATPIISNDSILYFLDFKGIVQAISLDGTIKWTLQTGEWSVHQALKLDQEGNLYFITNENDRFLYKLSPSGEIIYRIKDNEHWGSIDAFSTDGITAYIRKRTVNTGPVIITAIDLDGNIKWDNIYQGNMASPLIVDSDNHIFFSIGMNNDDVMTVYSLNGDGSTRWTYEHSHQQSLLYYPPGYAPTIDWEGNLYFLGKGRIDFIHELISFTNDGDFRWSISDVRGISLICDKNNNIYCYTWGGDSLYYSAISSTGNILWSIGGDIGITNSHEPIIGFDNSLYILSSDWNKRFLYHIW